MLNYIRGNLYRLRNRREFCFLCLILLLLSVFSSAYLYGFLEESEAFLVLQGFFSFFLLLVTLFLNEAVFHEDMSLGLFRNDMNIGLSDGRLYAAIYLTGAVTEIALWVVSQLCSVLVTCAIWGWGMKELPFYFNKIFFGSSLIGLIWCLLFLAFLQMLSVLVKKASMGIWLCLVFFLSFAEWGWHLFSGKIPEAVREFFQASALPAAVMVLINGAVYVCVLGLLLLVGCVLFRRSER